MSMPEGPSGGQPGYPPAPSSPPPPGAYPPPPGPVAPPAGPEGYYPQPGQPAWTPPPQKRSRAGLVALGVIILLVVAIVGGLYVFRDRISGEASGLQIGDCIDLPTSGGDFTDVQHQPCNSPHDAEVIMVLTHPAAAGEAYPVVSGFDDYIEQNCVPAFRGYTGRDYQSDTTLELGYFHPTMTSWSNGDRGFTCHVYRIDRQKMSASVRAGAPASP